MRNFGKRADAVMARMIARPKLAEAERGWEGMGVTKAVWEEGLKRYREADKAVQKLDNNNKRQKLQVTPTPITPAESCSSCCFEEEDLTPPTPPLSTGVEFVDDILQTII